MLTQFDFQVVWGLPHNLKVELGQRSAWMVAGPMHCSFVVSEVDSLTCLPEVLYSRAGSMYKRGISYGTHDHSNAGCV